MVSEAAQSAALDGEEIASTGLFTDEGVEFSLKLSKTERDHLRSRCNVFRWTPARADIHARVVFGAIVNSWVVGSKEGFDTEVGVEAWKDCGSVGFPWDVVSRVRDKLET